jgi:aryl-alcohol dehydrogenase-like predicted oxidoreductase
VRYVARSNMAHPLRIVEAFWISHVSSLHRLIAVENAHNLMSHDIEHELITARQRYGLGLISYFPMATCVPVGKYLPLQKISIQAG